MMVAIPWNRLWAALRPVDTLGTSVQSQARLLDMSFSRLRFSIYMMPLIALVLMVYFRNRGESLGVNLWGGGYLVFGAMAYRLGYSYQLDREHTLPELAVQRWLPRVKSMAWLHGAGLAAAVLAMAPGAPQELRMLLYLVIAHIITTNATHQTPTIGVFLRFFALSWHGVLVLSYWIFPELWHFVIPLGLIYSLVIYRHALISHRFAIEQVHLKEHSEQLAEQSRVAKEHAETALQEKNLFLTTASHDLRQPVHAMSFLVEAIELRNQQAALTPLLIDLRQCMSSMNNMFNALLDLSRLEAGMLPQRATALNLHTVVQEIVTLFREQAHQRGLRLRTRLPRCQAMVWADHALMRQALSNLVHNALRYTRRGGVLIGLRRRAQQWQIEVWDTGMGISAQDEAQIFSPYFRNQHARRIDSVGHGLGLAVVARCARLLDAKLDFQSRLGRGSRFWLSLGTYVPHATALPVAQAVPIHAALPTQPLHGTCLVLDDDPQVQGAWRVLLEGWGVQVRFAANAQQALRYLKLGFVPQAIFCDQRLRSGESGFDILRALLARYPQAGGAMVSGEINSPELSQAQEEGFLVLRKPLETVQLHALLSTWLVRGDETPPRAN